MPNRKENSDPGIPSSGSGFFAALCQNAIMNPLSGSDLFSFGYLGDSFRKRPGRQGEKKWRLSSAPSAAKDWVGRHHVQKVPAQFQHLGRQFFPGLAVALQVGIPGEFEIAKIPQA